MQIEGGGNRGSQQPSYSESWQTVAFRKNDSVKKEALQLTLIGELPDTVRTSTVLKSKNGQSIKLVLVDPETGGEGVESCAEVEIVVLEGDHKVTPENFERRIIKTGEKKKPHFVKRVFKPLVNGVGYLNDVKLGQDSTWTNIRKCRLGARIINGHNLYAWTSPFEVKDNRLKVAKKHYPPLHSSEIWRLKRICRGGERHKRLKAIGIDTVSHFLCRLQRDPEGLKKIVLGDGGGDNEWKAIVEHAQSCTTDDDDDDQMMSQTNVGKLKSRFVSIDNLSAADTDGSASAIGEPCDFSFQPEAYELHNYAPANFLQQQDLLYCNNLCQAPEVGSSPWTWSMYPSKDCNGMERYAYRKPCVSYHTYQASEVGSSSNFFSSGIEGSNLSYHDNHAPGNYSPQQALFNNYSYQSPQLSQYNTQLGVEDCHQYTSSHENLAWQQPLSEHTYQAAEGGSLPINVPIQHLGSNEMGWQCNLINQDYEQHETPVTFEQRWQQNHHYCESGELGGEVTPGGELPPFNNNFFSNEANHLLQYSPGTDFQCNEWFVFP